MENTQSKDRKKILNHLLTDVEEVKEGLNLLFQPVQGKIKDDLIYSIQGKLGLLRMRILDDLAPVLRKRG